MPFVDGLITLADAKTSLGITTSTNDADLEKYIMAATPVIENITGPMIARSITCTRDGGGGVIILGVPFNAVSTLVESGVTITDYVTDARAGLIYAGTTVSQREFKDGLANIVATVTVGTATIPQNVQLAARELVRHWWQQGRQANRPGFGNEFTDSPAVSFGVPTRRLEELLSANAGLPGFA